MRSLVLFLLIDQLFSVFAATTNTNEEIREYIVGFHPITEENRLAHHNWVKRDLLSHLPHNDERGISEEFHISSNVSGYFGRFTEREVDYLKKSSDISQITENAPIGVVPDHGKNLYEKRDEAPPSDPNAPNDTNANKSDTCDGNICTRKDVPWHLARISHKENTLGSKFVRDPAYDYVYEKGIKNDVTIYAIDTGLNVNHKEIEGKNVQLGLSTAETDDKTDIYGHGTSVAALIVGNTVGVFPDAHVVVLNTLKKNVASSLYYEDDMLRCIEWLAQRRSENPQQKSIIVMAMQINQLTESFKNALKALLEMGFGIVAAAGNDNKDLKNIGSVLNHDNLLYVGSSNILDMKGNSNYGEWVSIFAPGENLLVANGQTKDQYIISSGTSASAPQVAGAAALLWSKYPEKSFTEIASLLKNGNRDVMKGDTSGCQNALLYTLAG